MTWCSKDEIRIILKNPSFEYMPKYEPSDRVVSGYDKYIEIYNSAARKRRKCVHRVHSEETVLGTNGYAR